MGLSYPIYLSLENKKCVIIGGGRVAQRKLEGLLQSDAEIVCISPEARSELKELAAQGKLRWEEREFEPMDLEGATLVFVATDQPQLNREIADLAKRQGAWVNVADQPELGDFTVPSTVRRGDLAIAISTRGASPALAKQLRFQIERAFGLEYETYLAWLGKWREDLKEQIESQARREEIFKAIIDSDCLDLIRQSDFDKANARVDAIVKEYLK